jgi:hypothetical protein
MWPSELEGMEESGLFERSTDLMSSEEVANQLYTK